MCLVFEKKMNINVITEEDVDEVFVVACEDRQTAEGYIANFLPSLVDRVIYKEYMIHTADELYR
jgi:hypothetical protein